MWRTYCPDSSTGCAPSTTSGATKREMMREEEDTEDRETHTQRLEERRTRDGSTQGQRTEALEGGRRGKGRGVEGRDRREEEEKGRRKGQKDGQKVKGSNQGGQLSELQQPKGGRVWGFNIIC